MVKELFKRAGLPLCTYSNFNELKSIIKARVKEWVKIDP